MERSYENGHQVRFLTIYLSINFFQGGLYFLHYKKLAPLGFPDSSILKYGFAKN